MPVLTHGGDIYSAREKGMEHILDFSANINPLGLPRQVQLAAEQAVRDCVHYPDPLCRALAEKIARHEQVKQEWIICGNGAADVLFRLIYALRPHRALLLSPTFSEYEQALHAIGCRVSDWMLKEADGFHVTEEVLQQLDPALDLLILCNPNNPTGVLIDPPLLQKVIATCAEKHIFLVIDECFNDFLQESERHTVKPYLAENTGLFILKAFTKFYGLAGLRLGYGLCSCRPLLERIQQVGQPWSVSVPAQAAGVAAMEPGVEEYRVKTKRLIFQERLYLSEALQRIGLHIFDGQANYLFFKVEGMERLEAQLEQQGILIRSCGNYRGLTKEFYRVAVRTHQENEQLVAALQKILGQADF